MKKIDTSSKTFLTINFGCRVNAAEINQLAQKYIDMGYSPYNPERNASEVEGPDLILVNTCSVTKKGDIESLSRIRTLRLKYPQAKIIATGCARLDKIKDLPNLTILINNQKNNLSPLYTPQVKDKFSHTHRYLLKVQSGCSQMCSYCIVPYRRNTLWSLPINQAVDTVKQAVKNGYTEVIITGVNLDEYKFGFSNLVEALLKKTDIKLISFGSIPVNCLDIKFLKLIKNFKFRIKNYLHIPIQSGSDKILKLMHRPYHKVKIIKTFDKLKTVLPPFPQGEVAEGQRGFAFGTDIIIGFPGETEDDFQQTLDLCKQIGFQKIHTFKFSPRPLTTARLLWQKSPKISPQVLKERANKLLQITKS